MEGKLILHCYCLTAELEHDMLTCIECRKRFHQSCLKSGRPSSLAGDIYFNFTCQNCSHSGTEVIQRKKLQWTLVIMIALYNLQLQGAGKCGYFRWREHICRFIDKNWAVLFGEERKKSATWHGTVAGALSTGANRYFMSGMEVLGENGWWSLKSSKLPSLDELDSIALSIKASRKRQVPFEAEISPVVEGSRKKNQNAIEAAVALKEKKASIDCDERSPKPKKKRPGPTEKAADSTDLPLQHKLKLVVSHPDISKASIDCDERSELKKKQPGPTEKAADSTDLPLQHKLKLVVSHPDISKASIDCDERSPEPMKEQPGPTEKAADSTDSPLQHKLKLVVSHPDISSSPRLSDENCNKSIPKIFLKEEDVPVPSYSCDDPQMQMKASPNIKLMDQNPVDEFDVPGPSDNSINLASVIDGIIADMSKMQEYESEEENNDSDKTFETTKKFDPDTGRKRKVVPLDENPNEEAIAAEENLTLMSPFEEGQLLQKLQNHYTIAMKEKPALRRLYRKLMVRKLKREWNLPVFDIDAYMRSLRGMDPPDYMVHRSSFESVAPLHNFNTILDRFQVGNFNARGRFQHHTSFRSLLMGLEGKEETSFVSPYTERVLKPFIFRDYEMKPLKLQLLEEILHYTNRNNPNWIPPKQSPIDFCYVRPHHIPSVNALCHKFFWPGIDMSECLQYPDFSCVTLYKKLVIGFAFLVPDVKYNEAYVTYIFCHPEWQRSGIGSYMLYHLIQTCWGKDVTLHVSASSAAITLYEGMGFEVEEFIHDFYDKYLPPDSKECRHALFLRLRR
ncbi:cysteine-rich protein 2-binding protein [Trichonephila clavata]|uniref:Cysteine-rich protein 2-binding protein n=1 Tax=Trichonephila clavata TaxID=2740835 RepID=A0A8X6GLT3_TRICU|nr:cysteine-rich protein 2-binding protein [Trichonephila clavata]